MTTLELILLVVGWVVFVCVSVYLWCKERK